MSPGTELLLLGTVFLISTIGIIRSVTHSGRSSGILIGYLTWLWMLHAFAIAYISNSYSYYERSTIVDGFRVTVIGLTALWIGSTALARLGRLLLRIDVNRTGPYRQTNVYPGAYVAIAVLAALLFPFLGQTPTVGAIISSASGLMTVAICLYCWRARQRNQPSRILLLIGVALIFPLITITQTGFFGVGGLVALLAFLASFHRPRWLVGVLALLVIYAGLSVFVTYMRDRTQLRDLIAAGSPLSERTELVAGSFRSFEWFNLANRDHLLRLDSRLNQNYLVGSAVHKLQTTGEYLNGQTIWDAAMALVPRALWSSKPVEAGSGDLVEQSTGLDVNEKTSVGVGHVLELYINYGTAGVIVGFLVIGAILRFLDETAGRRLRRGDWQGFALLFSVGLVFLPTTGGSFVELTASAGATVLVIILINHVFLYRSRHRPRAHSQLALSPK